jgi:asparagine synthase (glutamine-hydrolysing)
MCGLLGVYSGGKTLDNYPLGSLDLDAMYHRGPDAQGWHVDDHIIMGFRRLAIIDLSGGGQPLYSEDEQIVLLANGEIYNHHEIRQQFQKHHRFRTHSDCESLIHLYQDKGLDFLKDVNGMFGFALYDRRRNRLVLGRDRAGQKPMYYAHKDGILRWGSELKTFMAGDVPPINKEAVAEYLRLGYVPAPLAMLEGVHKLPAASILVIEGEGEPRIERYWQVKYERDNAAPLKDKDLDEWSEMLREGLRKSVGRRLESEVPMGFLLSGGVDSSAVFALGAAEMAPDRPTAFTIGFESPDVDETPAAAETAKRYKAKHRVRVLPREETLDLGDVLFMVEEPISTDALLPTAKVFEAVSNEGITTVLAGEGSDELLAGYRKFRPACLWLDPEKEDPYASHTPLERYLAQEEFIFPGAEERSALIGETVWDGRFEELEREAAELDPLSQMLLIESRMRLPDRINQRLDRLSMAYSIEARAPFMDYTFIELCARIPNRLRRTLKEDKAVLRHAMRDMLPRSVLDVAKAPFRAPDTWFVQADDIEDILGADAIAEAGMVQPDEVRKLREKDSSERGTRERLYALYVLHKWYHAFYKPMAENRWSMPRSAPERETAAV